MLSADAVARSAPERACLEALRSAVGAGDSAMERHCLRAFLIARRMAAERALALDEELLLCAALLHDVGIYPSASTGDVYVRDGARFTRATLEPFGWAPERLTRCLEAVERHHQLRPQWEAGAEVELLRRADLVEVSAGIVSFGLPRRWLRGLFRAVPRTGIYRELAKLIAAMARERPATMPRIFAPPRRGD